MSNWSCRALTASTAAVVACGLLSMSPAQANEDVTINLVAINDFHGQIDYQVVQWAATVEQLLAEGSADNTLLLSAGDNVGDSLRASSAQNDDPAIDVLNVLGVDASAVGNHEFDKGYDDLVNHIMKRADFPILGANVKKTDGSSALDPSATYTVSGIRIAVIGAVTETTPDLVEPSGITGLTFGNPVTAINAEVDRLNLLPDSQRPDVMVAVIHEGASWGTWTLQQAMQSSSIFTSMVEDTSPDVDAIITGHTHNTYVYDAPVPGEPGRTRPMIQTGYHGRNVGQIKLTVNSGTGEVSAYVARNVARLTGSDDSYTDANPRLATIAQIRDDAVAFAAAKDEEAAAVKVELDDAESASEDAYVEAQRLKGDYEAAVAARDAAYATASEIKQTYDAAVTDGRAEYAEAQQIRERYDVAVLEGRADYAAATSLKQAYDAEVAGGKAAYTTAATIKQNYLVTVADGKESYAVATRIKLAYDAAAARGKSDYETAATIKQSFDAAIAEGKAAYASAANIKEEYLGLVATGDPDANIRLGELTQQYVDAVAAGDAAYSRAGAMKPDYEAAIASAQAAYAEAAAMKPDYDAAAAAGKAAYERAAAMVPDYNAAIAAGKAAYERAGAMVPDYNAAIAAGKAAYERAATIKPEYDAAIATLEESVETMSAVKDLYDAAVETLNSLLSTVATLKDRLLGLL